MKKTILAITIFTAIGTSAANAAPVATNAVFTMYSAAGLDNSGVVPGGSFVNADATATGFVDQAAGTWGVSSSTAFFGFNWTASSGTLYTAPGNYALDTTTGIVALAAPVTPSADGMMHFTVGVGQVAGTINLAWTQFTNIRVVEVWNVNSNGSLIAAVVPGMENGPFPDFNAAFNLNTVPLPAAFWLFGSGLVGLLGFMRRRSNKVKH